MTRRIFLFAQIAALLALSSCHKATTPAQAPAVQPKWTFIATGPVNAALALASDGTLYAASEDGYIFALDPHGTLLWKFEAGPTVAAPIVGPDGTIYVATMDQQISALNPGGTQQWTYGGGPYANKHSPWRGGAIDQNYLYTPWRGVVRAIRLTTGSFEWSTGVGFEEEGSVSILPNGLIAFPGAGRLDAADSSGKTAWNYPVMNPPLSLDMLLKNNGRPPIGRFWLDSGIAVGADGTLYVAATGSRFLAISSDGLLKLEFKSACHSTNRATPVIAADGAIYFACGDGVLYAFSSDGSPKWTLKTGAPIAATPALAQDGTIFVLNDAAVLSITPEGQLLSTSPFAGGGKSSLNLGPDGTLYAATKTGKVAAFPMQHGPLMNSPWPKFQHDPANTAHAPRF